MWFVATQIIEAVTLLRLRKAETLGMTQGPVAFFDTRASHTDQNKLSRLIPVSDKLEAFAAGVSSGAHSTIQRLSLADWGPASLLQHTNETPTAHVSKHDGYKFMCTLDASAWP